MGAATCLVVAFLIVVQVGLPERAEFTGQMIPGELPIAPEIGAIAPPFEHVNLQDVIVRLADLRGQPVVINFWATWCEPCKVEMPALEAVYNDYRERGLHLLAINLGETAQASRQWVDAFGLTFDVLLDPRQETAALYQLRGQPSTYIVSPGGMITAIFYGPMTQDSLKAAIAPFFTN